MGGLNFKSMQIIQFKIERDTHFAEKLLLYNIIPIFIVPFQIIIYHNKGSAAARQPPVSFREINLLQY